MTDTTLNSLWKKTPPKITQDDLKEHVVDRSRRDRALWEVKEEKTRARKAKKREGVGDE